MKKGAVLVDVSIDQGGCFETSRPTTHTDPTYEVDGVTHYCVANMPGAVPITSTYALTNATLPYVLHVADAGVERRLAREPGPGQGRQRRRRQGHLRARWPRRPTSRTPSCSRRSPPERGRRRAARDQRRLAPQPPVGRRAARASPRRAGRVAARSSSKPARPLVPSRRSPRARSPARIEPQARYWRSAGARPATSARSSKSLSVGCSDGSCSGRTGCGRAPRGRAGRASRGPERSDRCGHRDSGEWATSSGSSPWWMTRPSRLRRSPRVSETWRTAGKVGVSGRAPSPWRGSRPSAAPSRASPPARPRSDSGPTA